MPSRPPHRHPLAYLVLGIALAGMLAAVLFGGVGASGTSSAQAGETSTQQEFTAANLQPGINAATGLLLSLTVIPSSDHRVAPDVRLTDQSGRPVSLRQLRGRVVVVSANDDQCTDLCTLLANDVVLANRDLGAAARHVAWLSINANPFYPQVSAVRAWTDQHGLGDQPNWYFGTAAPAALAAAWRNYGIAVERDAATRTVQHSTELFFVDPAGTERAVAEFGTASADTALFAHGLAQMADDLLPRGERVRVAGPETPAPSQAAATIGATAPDFSLARLGAPGRFRLSSTRGHWTVLDFWSSTCSACRADLPRVEAAARSFGAQVDTVGVDVADQPAPARALARRAGLTFPLVADPSGVASGGERISGLPFLVVLDPQGKVVIRHPGTVTTEQLDYLLQSLDPTLSPAA